MNATLLCQHNSLVQVVSAALGNKPEGNAGPAPSRNEKDVTRGAADFDMALLAINKMAIMG